MRAAEGRELVEKALSSEASEAGRGIGGERKPLFRKRTPSNVFWHELRGKNGATQACKMRETAESH